MLLILSEASDKSSGGPKSATIRNFVTELWPLIDVRF